VRSFAHALLVTVHDLVDKTLHEVLLAADRAKGQHLNLLGRPALGFLAAIEEDLERTTAMPEPVVTRGRNEGDVFPSKCGIQIEVAYSLQKFLIEKPFLRPNKRVIIILDGEVSVL